MTAPPENARRFPNLPLTRPVPLAAMIEEATKAVVGQLIRLAPPNSATMLGRSVAVISTFIECSSTPPNKTQRVSTRGHARSARQLASVVTSRTTNLKSPKPISSSRPASMYARGMLEIARRAR
jgi:hypothetical protein